MPDLRVITSHPSEALERTIYPRIGMFIDGNWIHDRQPWVEVRNPSTENILGPVPKATPADLQLALDAADRGFRVWRDVSPRERASVILRGAALLRERTVAIAKILSLENGKHLSHAIGEIERCGNFYEWEAAQAMRAYGTIVPSEPRMQKHLLRQPIGPVVAFTPWNVPMSAAARKTSAALAAGCSVILKAAEETPGTACALVQCFADAGLPPGVFNLVFGNPAEISTTLIASPLTRLVTFTGSTNVGKHLAELAARAMKPALMELGGNAPVLVTDSVDAAAVARLAAEAKSRSSGQICASVSRFIVHRRIYDTFVSAFAEALDGLKLGDAFTEGVDLGPVANARRLAAVHGMVEEARVSGARVAAGGYRVGERGYFFAPTVLADVPLQAQAMTTELFGPVAACVRMDDLNQGIKIANNVSVGLAAYAFTNVLGEAEQVARELECGVLSINHFGTPDSDTPFGGLKDSGLGREGGPTSLDPFLVTKTVLQSTARV